ncbi:MAG: acyl-CoA dehydrogenase family protein, partial [Chloroflexota bacterium]
MELDVKDFRLPQDLDRYRAAVRELVGSELEVLSEEIEETNAVPPRLMPLLRKAGLLRLRTPREWGGFGLTLSQFWPIQEETARSHGTIRTAVRSFGHKWMPIYLHGTEEQKKKYLPLLLEDYAGFALTEPDS